MRLDRALVDRGLVRSRTEAQSLIDARLVTVDGVVITKASTDVDVNATLDVTGALCPYVGRGGLKLAAALDHFTLDVTGHHCLDVGASTGGFTDCLLQRGASHVVAVDVGHGQLHPTLATDPRVELREGVNAREMKPEDFGPPVDNSYRGTGVPACSELPSFLGFDTIVADLSFISLTLVIPAMSKLAVSGGQFVLLVKPQFEVGPSGLGKGGIVRSEALRQDAMQRVKACAEANGLVVKGSMVSPVIGGDGNEEFLLWAVKE